MTTPKVARIRALLDELHYRRAEGGEEGTSMTAVPFPEPIAGDHHVVFYADPTTLTETMIDPLLWPVVQRINESGWVWTAEACQGHPEDASPFGPWAGNHRAMIRLVCRKADLGRLLAAVSEAVQPDRDNPDDMMSPLPWEPWVEFRPFDEPHYAEALIYIGARGQAVGGRDRSIRAWHRFTAAIHQQDTDRAAR